jgi:hypothetical protein
VVSRRRFLGVSFVQDFLSRRDFGNPFWRRDLCKLDRNLFKESGWLQMPCPLMAKEWERDRLVGNGWQMFGRGYCCLLAGFIWVEVKNLLLFIEIYMSSKVISEWDIVEVKEREKEVLRVKINFSKDSWPCNQRTKMPKI